MICSKCNKEKNVNKFFKTRSSFTSKERIDTCNECIDTQINNGGMDELLKFLRFVDTPFVNKIWFSDKVNENIGIYMKNIALNNKNDTYIDSDTEVKQISKLEILSKEEISDELVDKWGIGYTFDEYLFFEKKYKQLIQDYDEKTSMHSENLKTYIRYSVKAELATARGEIKDAKDWASMATKAAQDAKINVSQLSKSDISGGIDLITQLYEAVESEVGIIPVLPRLLEQPYDDADMIIWSNVNYLRRLEEKPRVSYRDIWSFYDEMIDEYCLQKGFNHEQTEEFKQKRNNVFRDMEEIFIEPLYEDIDEGFEEENDSGDDD